MITLRTLASMAATADFAHSLISFDVFMTPTVIFLSKKVTPNNP